MPEDNLNDLNNFLSELYKNGADKLYKKKIIEAREIIYRNNKIRAFLEAFAAGESSISGRDPIECLDYIYRFASVMYVDGFLKLE